MYIAWSAAHKSIHILPNKQSVIKQSLHPRDWDCITITHMHKIPVKSSLLLTNEAHVRFVSYMQSASTHTNTPTHTNSNSMNKHIYWAPLGLIDMLNSGGAVDNILNLPESLVSHTATTSENESPYVASFTTHGPGRFGLFSSIRPVRIMIDKHITLDLTNVPDTTTTNSNTNDEVSVQPLDTGMSYVTVLYTVYV